MNTNILSLNQAAKVAKKSPSTISKYLNNGKLSFISKEDGKYKIDRTELLRVFPPSNDSNTFDEKNWTIANRGKSKREYTEIETENRILRERLELRDKEISLLNDKADNLENERNDWKKQAQTLLLQAPAKPPEEKKGFWARLFGE